MVMYMPVKISEEMGSFENNNMGSYCEKNPKICKFYGKCYYDTSECRSNKGTYKEQTTLKSKRKETNKNKNSKKNTTAYLLSTRRLQSTILKLKFW